MRFLARNAGPFPLFPPSLSPSLSLCRDAEARSLFRSLFSRRFSASFYVHEHQVLNPVLPLLSLSSPSSSSSPVLSLCALSPLVQSAYSNALVSFAFSSSFSRPSFLYVSQSCPSRKPSCRLRALRAPNVSPFSSPAFSPCSPYRESSSTRKSRRRSTSCGAASATR